MSVIVVKTPPCVMCEEVGVVHVPAEGYTAWKDGAFIQDALPMLNDSQREQLITGTHPACWDELCREAEE